MVRGSMWWMPVLFAALSCTGSSTTEPEAPPPEPEPAEAPAPAPEAASGPNVLILLWDTVRADHLSLYGYDRPTTPHLEAFAKDALVFEQAFAPGMWTLPTHASMFTGLPATTHGAHASYRWLDNRFVTLPEWFSQNGYETWAFSSNLIASPLANLYQGFEHQHLTYKPPHTAEARKLTRAKLMPEDASSEISPKFAGNNDDEWEKSVFKDAAPYMHGEFAAWLDSRPEDCRHVLKHCGSPLKLGGDRMATSWKPSGARSTANDLEGLGMWVKDINLPSFSNTKLL